MITDAGGYPDWQQSLAVNLAVCDELAISIQHEATLASGDQPVPHHY